MKTGEDGSTPGSSCTACGHVVDAAFAVLEDDDERTDVRPSPGDFVICIKCGHLMAYDEQLKLRELNKDEAYEIAGDQRILMAQRARGGGS